MLACRFDELSEDTPLNRVFKAAVRRLASVTRSAANARMLAELAARLEFVGDSAAPLKEPVRLDRTNTAFHDLHRLARLLLSGDWQSMASGKSPGFSLLFPMHELFEKFVVDAFRRHQGQYRVQAQGPQQRFAELEDANAFANAAWPQREVRLKPDIALMRGDKVRFILDAKWKEIGGTGNNNQTHKVDQSDIYQLYSYGRKFDCRNVALIYPKARQFRWPLRYKFDDAVRDQPLTLWCFPFDVRKPCDSVKFITDNLKCGRAG